MRRVVLAIAIAFALGPQGAAQITAPSPITAIRAGRLLDPEAGRVLTNQIILVEGTRIRDVGANVAIPAGAQVIDLSQMTVMPGLVEAHNHLALTYKPVPENNIYYFTYVQESTALRAIQAASNGIQMLASGFTIVRDMGNNGNYADTALRQAIEQGWIPGPTIINSGIIIGGMGGQFFPTPEMAKDHNIVYPEYLDADTPDEIVKAVRQNILFGAKVIKICVDCKPYGYTVDEIRLFIREAAKAGLKVEGHVQTLNGARNAIDAGIWSIAHSRALDDEMHKLMAKKGVWRAGTETPMGLAGHPVSPEAYKQTVAGLKNAYGQQGAADVLDRRGLLGRRQDARRAVSRVPEAVEGRRDPERRHPARDHDQRLQGERDRKLARANQAGILRRSHRAAR
jgi:imidazolonepropionase-like amidohydrolase